jgi:hypothetical protein
VITRLFPIRVVFAVLWLLAAGAGFALILNYQNTGGRVGVTPEQWPSGAQIALDSKHDTLVMFVHPRCPCTRASVEELNRLLAQRSGQVVAHVFFFKPKDFSTNWMQTDLWRSAMAIPGVAVHEDSDGAEARLFGAETSGYVLLYDPHGQLQFNGGITGGRGHAGDNAGENAVSSLLAGQAVSSRQTQVYGCSLLGKCDVACNVPPEGAAK